MTDSWRNSPTVRTARAPTLFCARHTHAYTYSEGFNSGPKQSASRITAPQN
ncbi:hypothetical protein ALC57_06616 [Trachymyrmex cornetzi]|uniref:Uncharacterized protein n=1 Tax=Trachymyrmex cornetzi TaxID=471704 RepID=A0A195E682_9HYME|nr:hypothetical protein ALC57_06616 [Trachymyrmex cornetzi]